MLLMKNYFRRATHVTCLDGPFYSYLPHQHSKTKTVCVNAVIKHYIR